MLRVPARRARMSAAIQIPSSGVIVTTMPAARSTIASIAAVGLRLCVPAMARASDLASLHAHRGLPLKVIEPDHSNQPSILRDRALDRTPAGLRAAAASSRRRTNSCRRCCWPVDPPTGYTGPSGIIPREEQENSHFVPMEDRWRIGFPEWDRYDRGHPLLDEYPYVPGA